MKSQSILMIASVFLFIVASPNASAVVVYDFGGEFSIDFAIKDSVVIKDSSSGVPTVVNLLPSGWISLDVTTYGNSQIIVAGGEVGATIRTYDLSQAIIHSGQVRALGALDNSSVIVRGGVIINSLNTQGSPQITISGGSIGLGISAGYHSRFTISGGSIGGQLAAFGDAHITISGGSIGGILNLTNSSVVTVMGTNFNYPFGQIKNTTGLLTGTLANGEHINNQFFVSGDATLILSHWPPNQYHVDALDGNDANDGFTLETAFATIQHAIDVAHNGDTILVHPSNYFENIDFKGKSIVVRGIEPNDPNVVANTIINGSHSIDPNNGATITFAGSEDANCVLTGFTITGGIGNYRKGWTGFWSHWGGGICIEPNASPTITKNVITGNSINGFGGANIYCGGNNRAVITHNIIENGNTLGEPGYESYGGGIYCEGPQTTTLLIRFNVIKNNHSDRGAGITCGNSANASIRNNIFWSNQASAKGGAVHLFKNKTKIINNSFVNNAAPEAAAIHCRKENQPIIANNIIAFNRGGVALSTYDATDQPLVVYNDFWTNVGGNFGGAIDSNNPAWVGNIFIDPLFANANAADLHLLSEMGRWDSNTSSWVFDVLTSPCIDAGDPCEPVGLEPQPNGGRINMGSYGGTIEASKSPYGAEPYCRQEIAGDANADCKIDFIDLAIIASHWLDCNLVPQSACWE